MLVRRMVRKFRVIRLVLADQDGVAIGGPPAGDVDPGVADKPDIPVGFNSSAVKRHVNRIGRGFVPLRVGRANQISFEIPVPAQLVGFCPKMAAGFVANDAQMTTQFFQQPNQLLSAVFFLNTLQMNRPVLIDLLQD